jgi:hypothetical protein
VGFDTDRTLFYISVVFAIIHLGVFATKLGRAEPVDDGEASNPMENR